MINDAHWKNLPVHGQNKAKAILIVLIVCFSVFPWMDGNQKEITKESNENYQTAMNELDELLKEITENYQDDTLFLTKLSKSQDKWNEYFKSQIELVFPKRNKQQEYGSVFPMCIIVRTG